MPQTTVGPESLILVRTKEFIDRLSKTNKTGQKVEIIKEYEDLKDILVYTFDPFRKFFVTSSGLKKFSKKNIVPVRYEDLFVMLDDLASRELSGHVALASIIDFMSRIECGKEIIPLILDKNLKTRVDASLINRAFPELIPEFDVALAEKLEDYVHKMDFNKDRWLASRKLDGVRVICICRPEEEGGIKFLSRAGNEFTTLQKVRDVLKECPQFLGHVIDGEMCIIDENGKENFKAILSAIMKKDVQVENPRFLVFDAIPVEDFFRCESDLSLSDRSMILDSLVSVSKSVLGDRLRILETETVKDLGHLNELLANSERMGWEGMMFRKDCHYEGKRTSNLLKGKKFHDAEYKVLGVTTGTFCVANTLTGREEEIETLAAVVIEHKGNRVQVGSGFSLEERKEYFAYPERIIGKTITVQYFEESSDKDGKISIRFPTLKAIYDDERSA